jgi:cytochrome c553
VQLALHKGRWAWLATALFISMSWGQERVQLCAACHGTDGNSVDPKVPSIAGQPKLFLETQLVLFREELRKSDLMLPVVKGLKDPELIKLAEHFSRLPAKGMESGEPNAALMKTGQERAKALRCGICHLSDFSGQNQVPRLAGQREAYLEGEMRAYRDGKRTGGDTIMAAALYGVGDADLKALAHFLSRSSTARAPGR